MKLDTQNLANLISIRNHLYFLLNSNSRNIIKKEEVNSLFSIINKIDLLIVQESLTSLKDDVTSTASQTSEKPGVSTKSQTKSKIIKKMEASNA